jgi:hypothetical protein
MEKVMRAWDMVLIKADSQDVNKGRAGVVQAVDATKGTVTILVDATADKPAEVVQSAITDVTRLGG